MHYTELRIALFLVFLITCPHGDDTCGEFIPSLLNTGAIMDGDHIWEAITDDVLACARSCVRMKKCRSFGFDYENGKCQAYSGVGMDVRPVGHVVHSDISRWPSQIDPDCFFRPCGEDEICVPGSLTHRSSCSHSCFTLSHRKCPQPEGTMSSQPRTIGSVYTHTCGRGTVGGDSALCLPTGRWNKTIHTSCTPMYGGGCGSDTDCAPIHGHCANHVCTCKTGSRYDHVERMCVEECPEGGIFRGKCYFINNTDVDFFLAQEVCNTNGGHLVEIETEEENTFVKELLKKMDEGRDAWTGMLEDASGVERWITTNDTLTFTDWRTGEPNNYYGDIFRERCTTIDRRAQFSWADIHCRTNNMPLCEKPL